VAEGSQQQDRLLENSWLKAKSWANSEAEVNL